MAAPVRKAVFPVGGLGTRFLPATKALPKEMLPIVDKPLIQYAVDEARAAGIEEFIFVTGKGKSAIEDHFDHASDLDAMLRSRGKTAAADELASWLLAPGKVAYTRQQEPLGLGHAVWCARHFIGDEPFAVLLPDDIFLADVPCLKQMVDAYSGRGGMVAAETIAGPDISKYGILDVAKDMGTVVSVRALVEKPSPADAPSDLAVVGRYIMTPKVFEYLDRKETGAGGEIQLTDALSWLAAEEEFAGIRIDGERFDCGTMAGYLRANVAFALQRDDLRDDLKSYIRSLDLGA
jgi:UTP--glucose-1-phosphate uridylyltransferase